MAYRMNAIGQQGQSPARFKIDPQANSCEPLMTNRIFSIEIAAQSTRMHHTLQRPMIAILDFTVEQTSALSIIFGAALVPDQTEKATFAEVEI